MSGGTSESSDGPGLDAGDTVTEETHGAVEMCIIQIRYFIYCLPVQIDGVLFPVEFYSQTGPWAYQEFY